jgi:SPP1 gp7 family putative phage head morphogenesis protein
MRARRLDLEAYRIPRPRPRVRRQLQPDAQRMFYFAQLRPFLARMHALVTSELLPVLEELYPDARTDAVEDERIRAALDRITSQFAKEMPPRRLRALTEEVFQRTSAFQRAQLLAQIKEATGFDPLLTDAGLEQLARAFIKENVDLIRTVPERYFEGIGKTVEEGVRAGRRAKDLAADLEERYGVAESQALLIANDQIGKAFGDLNRTRMEELGVEQFVWRTAGDNRVRDSHDELDGQVFSWDDPPTDSQTGEQVLPGEAINCRCVAAPVVEGLFS